MSLAFLLLYTLQNNFLEDIFGNVKKSHTCSGKGRELPEPRLSLFFLIGRIPVLAAQLPNLISLGFLADKTATIAPDSQGGSGRLLGGAFGKAIPSLIKKIVSGLPWWSSG